MNDTDEVIVAIASPTTPAARGVVRLSGDDAVSVLERLGVVTESRKSAFSLETSISVAAPLGDIPVRLLIWPTRRSYTGQPSAEIHTYGSLPILQAIVDAVTVAGARPARPGEFTMRAFLAGRLDLTQAEAVLGVIDAQSRGSLDYALRQLAGNLSRPLEQLRSVMLDLLADVEAGLDFVDEDIEFITDKDLVNRLGNVSQQLEDTRRMMTNRGGEESISVIAIRGEPNAGKSQLLNHLVNREAAIVANVAGTTRDVVSIDSEIAGHPVRFIDTAGIESIAGDEPDALISQQSQSQADKASERADIRLWCVDSSSPDFAATYHRLAKTAANRRQSATDLWVATKSDLAETRGFEAPWISTSSVSGEGIDSLNQAIVDAIEAVDAEETGSIVGTAARCRDSLNSAIVAIQQAISLTHAGTGNEFVSAELRSAVQYLGEVTGAVYTDDILDRVFGRFCIGK